MPYTADDVVIILPTLGRLGMLTNTLESLRSSSNQDWECVVVFDGEPIEEVVDDERIIYTRTLERKGYWKALNFGLELTFREVIVFAANDLIFHGGWLHHALACYNNEKNPGLMAFRDDLNDAHHACHGMITRHYLWVLYGEPLFPYQYDQAFGDSELTQFSRELSRFHFCKLAYVEHIHYDKKKREKDEIDQFAWCVLRGPDHATYAKRYKEWNEKGGREAAKKRL